MSKFVLALAGALLLSFGAIGVANAQAIRDVCSDCGGAGPAPGSQSTTPGEPFDPFLKGKGKITPDGEGTTASDEPRYLRDQTPGGNDELVTGSLGGGRSVEECGTDLGNLRRVRASAVRAVGYGDSVDVIPVCLGKSLGSIQENVQGLHAPIGQNETLMAALRSNGFAPPSVVGVVVNEELVVLYVH